ncbi:hypothetical protein [Sphingomonas glacialis]|uniref:Uncharacterized protein n=1 Tax=Sphingomonas glacialis TaxID=658225 RepID=A0A502G2T1_9SPHN|nr:hypothetical protein [Sphingomonas glacialis]TPG56188.1 hypothetical protein EAH76_01015 [Sphingomonas glacialis]
MIRTFFTSWGGAFGDTARVFRALPWLIVLMAGIELTQHVIEVWIGFFSPDAAVRHAAALQPIRMALGWPKMLMVWSVAFFTMRYLVTQSIGTALRPSRLALRRYVWVILFQFVPTALVIYAEPILKVFGLGGAANVMTLRAVGGLSQILLEPALLLWFVNAALGTTGYGPVRSARVTGWWYFWALALGLVMRVPFSQVHARLNMYAAGQPDWVLWPMLVLDALVVPVMVVAVAAVQLRAARAIAERRGQVLLEGESSAARAAVGGAAVPV